MKISEKLKSLFRRPPPTEEELAVRAKLESERAQIHHEGAMKRQADSQIIPPS